MEKKQNDFEIKDDDMILATDYDFPIVAFSDRVHNYLSQSIRNSTVIRLLGRAISYRPLLNHLQSLWWPIGTFQLIDIENNFYLAKFSDPNDYTHILTAGPWVIYGHYLIVQPWTMSFSVEEDRVTLVVV